MMKPPYCQASPHDMPYEVAPAGFATAGMLDAAAPDIAGRAGGWAAGITGCSVGTSWARALNATISEVTIAKVLIVRNGLRVGVGCVIPLEQYTASGMFALYVVVRWWSGGQVVWWSKVWRSGDLEVGGLEVWWLNRFDFHCDGSGGSEGSDGSGGSEGSEGLEGSEGSDGFGVSSFEFLVSGFEFQRCNELTNQRT